MAQTFAAQVDAWVRKTERRMLAVFLESARRVIEEMQKPVGAGGNMPVDTGFLRASLITTLNDPAAAITYRDSDLFTQSYDDGQTNLIIAGAKIGDFIYAVYGANYARAVNYGSGGRAPRQFVGLAAQSWQSIVDQVVREAKSRAAINRGK